MSGPVEVTQADREAAAEFVFSPDNFHPVEAMRLRWEELGEGLPLVQAFARHRIATSLSTTEAVAAERASVVAWLHGVADRLWSSAQGGKANAVFHSANDIEQGEHLAAERVA